MRIRNMLDMFDVEEKPVRTTAQIIKDVETRLGDRIIDPKRIGCLEGCKCLRCWHEYADRVIKGVNSEEKEVVEA